MEYGNITVEYLWSHIDSIQRYKVYDRNDNIIADTDYVGDLDEVMSREVLDWFLDTDANNKLTLYIDIK